MGYWPDTRTCDVFRDGPDNIKPVKKKSRGKIDGIVAAIMARKLAGLDDVVAEDPDLVVATHVPQRNHPLRACRHLPVPRSADPGRRHRRRRPE